MKKALAAIAATIASLTVIAAFAEDVTGIKLPRLATINDVKANTVLIAQNYSEDYEERIKAVKQDRREVRQYIYQIQQSGQPLSPDHQEELDDLNEKIDELKQKKEEFEAQSKG